MNSVRGGEAKHRSKHALCVWAVGRYLMRLLGDRVTFPQRERERGTRLRVRNKSPLPPPPLLSTSYGDSITTKVLGQPSSPLEASPFSLFSSYLLFVSLVSTVRLSLQLTIRRVLSCVKGKGYVFDSESDSDSVTYTNGFRPTGFPHSRGEPTSG